MTASTLSVIESRVGGDARHSLRRIRATPVAPLCRS
jgi:hypothetical protein